jgi:hypothetical protein
VTRQSIHQNFLDPNHQFYDHGDTFQLANLELEDSALDLTVPLRKDFNLQGLSLSDTKKVSTKIDDITKEFIRVMTKIG